MRLISIVLILFYLMNPVKARSEAVDAAATPETKALYANLKKIVSKGILFGHQDDVVYGHTWKYDAGGSDVKSVAGDYPAVFGWELGDLELGHKASLDSVSFDSIRQHIKEIYRFGGVNTISWHVNNPLGGNAWNCNTTEAVKSVLPGGTKHAQFVQWLDRLATFLVELRDDNGNAIPVLLRPYHEHTGSWFWWGSKQCSPQEYVALWRYTVDYLTKIRKLHNLLFVYSPSCVDSKKDYFERYPGDSYVDVLGVDIYHFNGDSGISGFIAQVSAALDLITIEASKRDKVAVLSETGLEGLSVANWWTDVIMKAIAPYPISYFLVWRNAYDKPTHFYAPYPGQMSCDNFMDMKKSGKILFRNDLPDMYR